MWTRILRSAKSDLVDLFRSDWFKGMNRSRPVLNDSNIVSSGILFYIIIITIRILL